MKGLKIPTRLLEAVYRFIENTEAKTKRTTGHTKYYTDN